MIFHITNNSGSAVTRTTPATGLLYPRAGGILRNWSTQERQAMQRLFSSCLSVSQSVGCFFLPLFAFFLLFFSVFVPFFAVVSHFLPFLLVFCVFFAVSCHLFPCHARDVMNWQYCLEGQCCPVPALVCTELAPLGQFSHRVAMSVCVCFAIRCIFFQGIKKNSIGATIRIRRELQCLLYAYVYYY